MFMNIVCPTCGHKWRVPERLLGQQVQCPGCKQLYQCGTTTPPSLTARPLASTPAADVKEMPATRTAEVQSTATIHYRCARCQKALESPAHLAGHKLNCPDCGQRLQIPQASTAPPVDNKTILAVEDPPFAASAAVSPAPATEEPILTVLPASPPVSRPREYCLECGVEVTKRPRIQTCPDCGSLFCSARCFRDHSYHAHPRRRG